MHNDLRLLQLISHRVRPSDIEEEMRSAEDPKYTSKDRLL